jgi:hypothetical protein
MSVIRDLVILATLGVVGSIGTIQVARGNSMVGQVLVSLSILVGFYLGRQLRGRSSPAR